ncbi:MBOAT family protein [Variovorax sp. PAMC28562]|uniref:MBOAT family O-acyltransferase n=1 Tax=Variovorax sp. PAMC28562 TaxID=2762323 RepID=UPI00164DE145|nr:MBOAT family O-acyltransferase [Variovorax sp. PAMC28562]QNK72173.1 MBOAT family protein [Variovorax sp. PAMC28562]
MLFNSFEFFGFFGIFLLVYFSSPFRYRPWILLVASYVFYMSWEPKFVLLLLFTTLVDFSTALVMANSGKPHVRKLAMVTALVLNFGILIVLKYGKFLVQNAEAVAQSVGVGEHWNIVQLVLPVGISFYTFQSVGYTLDVYFKRTPAERNLLTYAQYVAFFPQLVAGPIERARHMIAQFKARHYFKAENVSPAMWLIGWGLFKKMCVADQIAPFVNAIYSDPGNYSGSYTLLATVLFAIQIYCDFSGYSSIARGVAKLFDFELMINFRQPYFSRSLSEFWGRWHISLSTWFRDYLYKPLGGSRGTHSNTLRNVLIVFVISGIWHGASWCFAVWGLLHGVGLVVERIVRWNGLDTVGGNGTTVRFARGAFGWVATMVVVLVGWVFFRSATLSDAWTMLKGFRHLTALDYGTFKVLGFASFEILLAALFIPFTFIVEWVVSKDRYQDIDQLVGSRLSIVLGVALTYVILLFGVFGRREFIYFQF